MSSALPSCAPTPPPNTPAPGDVYNEGAQCTVAWAPEGLTADDLLLQAFKQVAGEKGSELQWVNMNVNETIRWLKSHLEQFAEDQVDIEEGLLYVRT